MLQVVIPALLFGFIHVHSSSQVAANVIRGLPITPPSLSRQTLADISASTMIVVDTKTGQTIFEKNSDTKRPMASITKLMTALIIAENHALEEKVTIPVIATQVEGHKVYLKAGEVYTVGSLLSALLISSSNDAAVALAVLHSGTPDAFVATMNQRAKELGLESTSFANPTGLDDSAQYSTAQDIAWLTIFVSKRPEIATRMNQPASTIASFNGSKINLYHTHALLHSVPTAIAQSDFSIEGGKTGTTDMAKQCLVSLVKSEDKEYVVVLMHSDHRYEDLTNIISSLNVRSLLSYNVSLL